MTNLENMQNMQKTAQKLVLCLKNSCLVCIFSLQPFGRRYIVLILCVITECPRRSTLTTYACRSCSD